MLSCLHSFFRQEQLTSVFTGKHTCLCSDLPVLLEGARAGSRGIFSWHCSSEGSSHSALLWRRPGLNKLHTEFLKIRGLLLQMKMYSSLHLDTA